MRTLAIVAALLGLGLAAGAPAHEGHDMGAPEPAEARTAPASQPLFEVMPGPRFEAPAAGTYELPPIDRVSEHALLDPSGERASLPGLAAGEVAFVSFVYLSCGEACPLATATLHALDRRIAARDDLAGRVHLVTVSFDPERDTPEAMGQLAAALDPRGRWRFLTAAGTDELAPVLSDFGQDALAERGPEGDRTGRLRHVLKVFLVDGRGRIRNVYSTGFLDLRILENDALTVLAETPSP